MLGLTAAVTARAQVAQPVPVIDLTQPGFAPEALSVGQRSQPEYDSPGVHLGGFILRPSLDLSEEYNSNIYGSHFDVRSDFITLLSPVVDLASDWNDDAVALHAEGDLSRHVRYTADNIDNAILQADGRLDILRDQTLSVGIGYQSLHEDRSSPESIAATELAGGGAFALYPTPFTVTTGRFAYVYAPSRIGFELDGTVNAYSFSNVPTLNGGVVINSDQNREEYTLMPKLSYEFEPGYQAFVQIGGNFRNYASSRDATPFHYQRSSSGYDMAIGTQFNIDRVITGQFFVGWQDQMYDDPRLGAVSGVNFGGSVLWNVTQLTSLRFQVSRSQAETILIGSAGLWDSTVGVTVEHELLRNVLITLRATYDNVDYQGNHQNDDSYDFNASVRWKFNRNLSTGITVDYTTRSSNVIPDRFDRDQVLIDLKGQF
jgi:hypothetical protein